jgi:hypothetical protein
MRGCIYELFALGELPYAITSTSYFEQSDDSRLENKVARIEYNARMYTVQAFGVTTACILLTYRLK